MQVLVTGDQGYIGAALVPMLRAAGHDVTGLDSDLYRACTYGAWKPDWPTKRVDLRDVRSDDLRGFDAVVHLAGLSNDPLGNLNPELTAEVNYRASVRLARSAKEAGATRFLFSSSCSTYGAAGDDRLMTEESAFNPVTPYGESKVRVEQEVSTLADDAFSPTYLRNATVYGFSPRLRFDLVLNNLVAWGMTTGRILLKSDGTPWRPIVHVEDVCRAFLAALEAPREAIHDEAFNVGSTRENYRIRELADIVQGILPDCRIEQAPGAGPDTRCYRVDFSKIHRMLPEFQPAWTAERGARQVLDAYRVNGLTLEDFEGPRYMRIRHIQKLLGEGLLDSNLRWTSTARTAGVA